MHVDGSSSSDGCRWPPALLLLLLLPGLSLPKCQGVSMVARPLIGSEDFNRPPKFPSFEQLHEDLFDVLPDKSKNKTNVVLGFSNPYNLRPDLDSFIFSWLNENFFHNVLGYLSKEPKFVVEVGSFHGHSATVMAKVLDQLSLQATPILCIDPFGGDVNIWRRYKKDKTVKSWTTIRDGRMLIYDQFMVNVRHSIRNGISSRHIIPFVTTSTVGARWLDAMGYTPDIIFLDSAHEEHETFMEIALYYRVLLPGGILFGDDLGWPAVKRDVYRFVDEQAKRGGTMSVEFSIVRSMPGSTQHFWVIKKPKPR
eukprot:TRINITY_DN15852_c0_g1_i2.p1 TRINITY_DN15852_c0_g1~~TRINITY_DN15852_c0_g1_i2.p1  ORF type:complete len:310 (+),score=44.64 TRINITY_DN15852_c0_g1_i2:294-1223(+)